VSLVCAEAVEAMSDPRKLAEEVIERGVGAWTTQKEVFLATELLSALDALDTARKEAADMSKAAAGMSADLTALGGELTERAEAAEAERDELQAALEELRRRWDELVVAADPSVMENR
jgi:hypothetical protein